MANKQILLIRHGKSSWDTLGTSDHDRPLNKKGEKDAPRMAAALKQRGVQPDLIVSSTALRATTTAQLVSEGLDFSPEDILYSDALYLASPQSILQVVQELDEGLDTVLFFGHNPGMHELANHMASSDFIESFPTLAVARLELVGEFWAEADARSAKLIEVITPRVIKQG